MQNRKKMGKNRKIFCNFLAEWDGYLHTEFLMIAKILKHD